jgi:hypothetical protein
VVLRESWALGSGHGGPEDDWAREIHSGVRAARPGAGVPAEDILAARAELEYPQTGLIEAPASPAAQTRFQPGRSIGHALGAIARHPLWSALIAALVAGAVLKLVFSDSVGDRQSQPRPSTGPEQSTTAQPPASGGPAQAKREQAGSGGARTYANPYTLAQTGPPLAPLKYVQVTCRVHSPSPPSVVPDGNWYRIASRPWNDHFYAPANSFWNGDVPAHRPYTHNTDFAVPKCR